MMSAKAPYTTLRDTVHIHPTVSELIPTICGELKPQLNEPFANTKVSSSVAIQRRLASQQE